MSSNKRAKFYADWGKSSSEWIGIYPNFPEEKLQDRVEAALARRAGSKSHLQATWANFDFVAYSGNQFHNFRGNTSPSEVLSLHATVARAAAVKKFGDVSEEKMIGLLNLSRLADEGAKKLASEKELVNYSQAYEAAKDAYSAVNKKVVFESIEDFINTMPKEAEKKLEKARSTTKEIRALTQKIQDILDALAKIPEFPGGGNLVEDTEGRLVGGIKMDKSAYTGAKNILAFMDDMNRIADDIERSPMVVPSNVIKSRKSIKLTKFSRDSKGRYSAQKVEQDFSKVARTLSGTLANLTGGIFEIAYGAAIHESLSKLYSSIQTLGPGSSTGSTTAPLGQVKFGTSKTDLRLIKNQLKEVSDVEINLSVKGQKMAKPTKLHDSNIDSVLKLIAITEHQERLLRIAFATPYMWERGSQMNTFISALMADVAVAGLHGDKIDLIAYSDGLMTIGKFYEKLQRNNTLHFTGTRGGSLVKSANDVVNNGTTKIIFQT